MATRMRPSDLPAQRLVYQEMVEYYLEHHPDLRREPKTLHSLRQSAWSAAVDVLTQPALGNAGAGADPISTEMLRVLTEYKTLTDEQVWVAWAMTLLAHARLAQSANPGEIFTLLTRCGEMQLKCAVTQRKFLSQGNADEAAKELEELQALFTSLTAATRDEGGAGYPPTGLDDEDEDDGGDEEDDSGC